MLLRLALLTSFVAGAAGSAVCSSQDSMNNNGHNMQQASASSASDCCNLCGATSGCVGYTWIKGTTQCWLKDRVDEALADTSVISGTVAPSPAPAPPSPPGPVWTPKELQRRMGMGTNLGNTLEAPEEGQWAPVATEADFDAFKAVNFTTVRVPVRWDKHTATTSPYTIDETWMARVEKVLGWSLARGFITLVNVHHDDWLDNQANFDTMLPRFEAIWEQVATRLKDEDQSLVFECFNEPHVMTTAQLNKMTDTCVKTIRKTNPTRVIMISGLQWDNPKWILNNPTAVEIPKDSQLMLHIHSYDPSDYTFKTHTVNTWGSDADRADLKKWAEGIQAWSEKNNLPVFYGEFGVTHAGQENRLDWYTAHYEYIVKFGWGASVWDDCGGFKVYDRKTNTWDTGVLKALGRIPPSNSAISV